MTPYTYNTINIEGSQLVPGAVHNSGNMSAGYFRKYLLQKAMSVFKWTLPDTWNRDYFLYTLYSWGYIGIFNTSEFGVIPQQCGLQGYNIFYAPKSIIVSNPLLPTFKQLDIDIDAVVLKLQPDYTPITDMISFYADKMALATESIDSNLINSKLAYVFTVPSKAAAESFKKMYDKISSGEPAVMIDKDLKSDTNGKAWDTFSNNLKEQYLVTDLLSDLRKLEAMFDTEIGIPNANTDKRERLITDEVNANNVETSTRAAFWLEELQKGCRQARDMFGININVEWRVNPNESNTVNSGNEPVQA